MDTDDLLPTTYYLLPTTYYLLSLLLININAYYLKSGLLEPISAAETPQIPRQHMRNAGNAGTFFHFAVFAWSVLSFRAPERPRRAGGAGSRVERL